MKKLLFAASFLAIMLHAEVISVLPYGGSLSYDTDSAKSIKVKAKLLGVHATVGTLKYLIEADYLTTDISYKDTSLENLNQSDMTFAYGKYFKNFMLRGGIHYISNNDPILGNGYVGFASIGGYKYVGYNKYTYGVEAYFSQYDNNVSLSQFTPYFTAYKSINANWGNALVLKANYQLTPDYLQNSYLSFDVSDTIYYKKAYLTLRGYSGEMVSGVKDSGFTVTNTVDLMKTGFGAKLGYYVTPRAVLSFSYDMNIYEEVDLVQGSSSVSMLSFYYGF
ncbi:hypothetical protein JHD46_04665 [Sulfurimonas sp. SAG-AH-194-C20]|nr:hypothetical protein [Sulfurimonas sp. SAG-AH-194-C20]MDF1878928.1 hypothetical protein [Sulfurimonas sp. SAG-AH-194-C20]